VQTLERIRTSAVTELGLAEKLLDIGTPAGRVAGSIVKLSATLYELAAELFERLEMKDD